MALGGDVVGDPARLEGGQRPPGLRSRRETRLGDLTPAHRQAGNGPGLGQSQPGRRIRC